MESQEVGITINEVTFLRGGSPVESMTRIYQAALPSGVDRVAIRALIILTEVAHGWKEGPVVIPVSALGPLESLRLIRQLPGGKIQLV